MHNNIFCKHPLNCAIYCTIVTVIAPSRQNLGVFEVFGGVFCLTFRDRILDGSRCLKKNVSCQTRKRGHYCTLLCDIPLPAPLYCLQYCAIYFPHDPLYFFFNCNKILAISCKGQETISCKGQIESSAVGHGEGGGGIQVGGRECIHAVMLSYSTPCAGAAESFHTYIYKSTLPVYFPIHSVPFAQRL